MENKSPYYKSRPPPEESSWTISVSRKLRKHANRCFYLRAGCASVPTDIFSFAQAAQVSHEMFSPSRKPRKSPNRSFLLRAGCASIPKDVFAFAQAARTRKQLPEASRRLREHNDKKYNIY